MTAIYWAGAGTLFPFLMTVLGAGMVFLFQKRSLAAGGHLFLSFAGGIMLAASLFSLLLPAMDRATALGQIPLLPATLGLILGMLLMLMLDKRASQGFRGLPKGTALTFLSITLHNIPEGMAVGLAFALASGDTALLPGAVTLALGIALQNFPEGAAVSLPLCREGFTRKKAFLFGALSGAVEPVFGMLTALFAMYMQPLLPLLMAFAAGAMLFTTFRETIPEAARQTPSPVPAVMAMLGFVLMMCMDIALG